MHRLQQNCQNNTSTKTMIDVKEKSQEIIKYLIVLENINYYFILFCYVFFNNFNELIIKSKKRVKKIIRKKKCTHYF